MSPTRVLPACLAALLAACSGAISAPVQAPTARPLLLLEQDLLTLQPQPLASGPVVSGSIQPELRADLRAEAAGTVLEVLHDDGDAVARGALLVRLDDSGARDNVASAAQADAAAAAALDQAQRQFARMRSLQVQQLVSAAAFDDAHARHLQAQSDRASAHARLVEARERLDRTQVRAPFAGVVGARAVSPGDTVQVGMPLLRVFDLGRMRFEGLVAADQAGRLRPGVPVHFRVDGVDARGFDGVVQQVDPVVDPSTRQVGVQVRFVDALAPTVAGLYAEGRIDSDARAALLLPDSALVRDGDDARAWVLRAGALHAVPVELGERDERHGRTEVLAGLRAGDRVLREPLGALRDGAPARVAGIAAGGR